jgi:hypothetical protein
VENSPTRSNPSSEVLHESESESSNCGRCLPVDIAFQQWEHGVYDCSPLLDFGVFRELRDPSYFRQVRVSGGTAVWPHEQDICPDTLYVDSHKVIAEVVG